MQAPPDVKPSSALVNSKLMKRAAAELANIPLDLIRDPKLREQERARRSLGSVVKEDAA